MKAAELKRRMAKLGETSGKPPKRHTWERHQYEIRKHCQRDDPNKFLQWSTLAETMFVGETEFIYDELDYVLHNDRDGRWSKAIIEPMFGAPATLSKAPYTSGNLVHQAYHLKKWQEATGLKINKLSYITEFGGGYGTMAYLVKKLGFTGIYTIEDLPEFALLQKFYLRGVSGDRDVFWGHDGAGPFLTNLMIACWSLSETELGVRDKFFDKTNIQNFLIAYQPQWQDIDNIAYFDSIQEWYSEKVNWFSEDACRGSRYLFGAAK